MLFLLLLFGLLIWFLRMLWISPYNLWKSRGFPQIDGKFPFGSVSELVTLTRYQGFVVSEMYKQMAEYPFFGIYFVRNPVLFIRDPEIIRLVLAKEFSHFRDRMDFQRSPKEFLSHHLFNLDGERWRTLRVKISPIFTSGKLKSMYHLFVKCAENLDELLLSNLNKTIDIKSITSGFTSDTICSCAFGIDANALKDPNSEFKSIGIRVFKSSLSNKIKIALSNIIPFLRNYKLFTPRFLPEYIGKFLLGVIKKSVDYRKTHGLKRNDFIDLLIDLKEQGTIGCDLNNEPNGNYGVSVEITYEMMTAQCFVFFAAGFETSSSVQTYCLYELALSPDIQEKLYSEIVKSIEAHGELSYQAINDMVYLDMVVHETMRKYPTLPILTRMCTKRFQFQTGHIIEKGEKVMIPVYALHHDPDLFPKPEVFDPERFSSENKEKIRPFSYLPFGEGPRICIGMRFGLLQTKMGLITFLRKYRVDPAPDTPSPMKFRGSGLITTTEEPIHLKLTKRDSW